MKVKATEYFHKKPDYFNCAQSILKSWQKELNIPEKDIDDFSSFGGGRAPSGLCGAIYAADYVLSLLDKPSVQDEFIKKLNHLNCSALRKSCVKCVEVADELVSDSIYKQA